MIAFKLRYDVNGRLVKFRQIHFQNTTPIQVSLAELKNGVYYIVCRHPNHISSKCIIKK